MPFFNQGDQLISGFGLRAEQTFIHPGFMVVVLVGSDIHVNPELTFVSAHVDTLGQCIPENIIIFNFAFGDCHSKAAMNHKAELMRNDFSY